MSALSIAPDYEDEGCTELVMVPWPNAFTEWAEKQPPCILGALRHYYHEWVIPNCREPNRSLYVFKHILRKMDPTQLIDTIGRADGRNYVNARLAEGVKPATARRELSLFLAALNHEVREERSKSKFGFQMPPQSEPRIRYLTREEYARLMRTPMPPRIYRFFLLAFGTGARARAIEQLTWDRVDLQRRTIDFRLPGVNHKNKRRVVAPISDALFPRLEAMYARRKDTHVIGLSEKGKCVTTYHAAKEVLRTMGINENGVARHVARHTFASWLLQEGVSIYEVAKLMGDTVGMVEKVYGHMQAHHLMSAVNRLH